MPVSCVISDETPSTLLLCTIRPTSCSSWFPISTNQSISLTENNYSCLAWEIPYAHSDAFPRSEEFVFLKNNVVSLHYNNVPSLSLQINANPPTPQAALSIFPFKKASYFLLGGSIKIIKQDKMENNPESYTFAPISLDPKQYILPPWITFCWSHTPSPYILFYLTELTEFPVFKEYFGLAF